MVSFDSSFRDLPEAEQRRRLREAYITLGYAALARPTMEEGSRVRVRAGDFEGTSGRVDDIDEHGVWVELDGEPALFDTATATLFTAEELDLEETP